jgi:O-acetyl-ADP-ribose deacetylase (regulator of RNase III)
MVLGPETVNPYLSARAVFLLIRHGTFSSGERAGASIADHVQSVAFPGMGTGVGRVPFAVCARQLRAAAEDVLVQRKPFPQTWAEASERHQLLYTDRLRRLQY